MEANIMESVGVVLLWGAYIAAFVLLARKGRGHDNAASGAVGFVVQAFAYVATYLSAVALVGFGGLAHAYGLQMLLVAAGNVWLGTWAVYKFLAWRTRQWQWLLGARSPASLLGRGHDSRRLGQFLALIFAVFLGVYASAVIKGAALLLAGILPVPLWALVWVVAVAVGACVLIGGLRGVLYTEAMQGAIMLAGVLLIVGAVFAKVGGPVQGVADLAALPAEALADNGFAALSSGEAGLFILSLVAVTSIAVWAQPQMVQRHFALASGEQAIRIAPLSMLVLTVVVGGTYFAASLSRLFLPAPSSPDAVMPELVQMLLPAAGVHLFTLAVVSASLSTATSLFHIAAMAVSEDVRGRRSTPFSWRLGIVLCILVSASCAQAEGRLIAVLCTTSWSMVGATALVPYLALVRFGRQNAAAAWGSALLGFGSCLFWYLAVYGPTAFLFPAGISVPVGFAVVPPFFIGVGASCFGWYLGLAASRICAASSVRQANHGVSEQSGVQAV